MTLQRRDDGRDQQAFAHKPEDKDLFGWQAAVRLTCLNEYVAPNVDPSGRDEVRHARTEQEPYCPMFDDYSDIRSLINRDPIWWDVHDVPRYAPFRPGVGSHGMPTECVLVLARARGGPEYLQLICGYTKQFERADHLIRSQTLAIGEPPAGLHAENGDLSAEPVKVLEYWRRDGPLREWRRIQEFEIELID